MDYEFTRIPGYQGDGKTVPVIEVFNTVTGKPITFSFRRPFENKAAWIARALADAEMQVAA